jgi:hypothetical protein
MLTTASTVPAALGSDEEYKLGADSMRQEDVPQGKVTKAVWRSNIFPDTIREFWVYVPLSTTVASLRA